MVALRRSDNHPVVVEIFQSGPKWWTDQPKADISICAAMLLSEFNKLIPQSPFFILFHISFPQNGWSFFNKVIQNNVSPHNQSINKKRAIDNSTKQNSTGQNKILTNRQYTQSTKHFYIVTFWKKLSNFSRLTVVGNFFLDKEQFSSYYLFVDLASEMQQYSKKLLLPDCFKSYLSNKTFSVVLHDASSSVAPLTCGARQGSILSPV